MPKVIQLVIYHHNLERFLSFDVSVTRLDGIRNNCSNPVLLKGIQNAPSSDLCPELF